MRAVAVLLGAAMLMAAVGLLSMHSVAGEGVVTEVFTEKAFYSPGEPVDVTVVVTNVGSERVTMVFPSSMVAYYRVADSLGEGVFNLSLHVAACCVITEVTLDPGEYREFLFEDALAWHQVDDDGDPVACPGDYVIYGCLDMADGYEMGQTTVTIGPEDDTSTEPPVSTIVTEVSTEKSHFAPGEPVNVTIVVSNTAEESVTLLFPTSLICYYMIEDQYERIVYNLRYHVYVHYTVTELTIGPGESLTYVLDEMLSWKQVDNRGDPVASPGEYTIHGCLDAWSTNYEMGGTTITIGSEASSAADGPEPDVVTEVFTDKACYDLGEPVEVTVVVRNLGAEEVTLTFRSIHVYYIVEDQHGTAVFDLLLHVDAAQVITEVPLGPGESLTYVLDGVNAWQQVDDDGDPVDVPGEYTIHGVLNTWDYGLLTPTDPYEVGSATVTLGDQENLTEEVPEFSSLVVVAVSLVAITLLIHLRRRGAPPGP